MGVLKLPYIIAVGLYCAGLFWLSHQSDPPIPKNDIFLFSGADKLVHGILYAGLCALLSVGFRRSNESPKIWLQWYVPVGFAILYGLSDEVHQLFVPQREFDWFDLVADGAGATFMQLSLFIYWRKSKAGE